MDWHEEGEEPDYRFSLANERTFLAWSRTALAVLAGAIVLHQFGSRMQPAWVVPVVAVALACFSALLGVGAYIHWRSNEIAMRSKRPLPRSLLMPVLAGFVLALSLFAAVVLVH
jgi:putative membrane protein